MKNILLLSAFMFSLFSFAETSYSQSALNGKEINYNVNKHPKYKCCNSHNNKHKQYSGHNHYRCDNYCNIHYKSHRNYNPMRHESVRRQAPPPPKKVVCKSPNITGKVVVRF